MKINTNAWNRVRYAFYAPFYDLVAAQLDRGRRRSVALLALEPGERVLIVGAGTGLDLPYLPPDVEVVATDLSPSMLRKARARAETLGRNVSCRVMDAQRLELPDDAFDAVLMHLILAVVPDPRTAIREAARVLKPGGRLGIFDKFLPDHAEASLLRRAAGTVTNVLFSDINRRLGPLLEEAGLVAETEEPSMFGGLFKVVRARKPAPESL